MFLTAEDNAFFDALHELSAKIHSINEMAVNGMLIATAGQLLNGPPILIQMQVWAKKGCKPSGPQSNQNQRMHMDYGNNTFVHPPPFVNPSAVSLIVYLSDTELTGGGTAVVPREGLNDEWYKPAGQAIGSIPIH